MPLTSLEFIKILTTSGSNEALKKIPNGFYRSNKYKYLEA